jgi:hypothetical protein
MMDEQFDDQVVVENIEGDVEEGEELTTEIVEESVVFKSGFAAGVAANRDAEIHQAGAFGIAAGRDMELSYGGGLSIAVGHDLKLTNGGALVMPVGNTAEITNGGALAMIGTKVQARNSFFGIVLAQQTTLEEGSQVLLNTQQALAFGAAFGLVMAAFGWLIRKK